ncbi:hypothetical protein DSY4831 [Desulfitobacterium hafniense Y51]|uniref:Uncharacterized protein n=1 Tax=Desulfitobacterium hafniense (strain Y51) TaxID=138119 RepID=Q24MX2_DESHY|nr:hypothetical protein DSY4831 [Desulfitobacterium hafniense Y51]
MTLLILPLSHGGIIHIIGCGSHDPNISLAHQLAAGSKKNILLNDGFHSGFNLALTHIRSGLIQADGKGFVPRRVKRHPENRFIHNGHLFTSSLINEQKSLIDQIKVLPEDGLDSQTLAQSEQGCRHVINILIRGVGFDIVQAFLPDNRCTGRGFPNLVSYHHCRTQWMRYDRHVPSSPFCDIDGIDGRENPSRLFSLWTC